MSDQVSARVPTLPSPAWLVNSHHLCLQRSYSSITHMTGKQDLDKFPSFSDSLIGIWNFSPGSVEIYDTGTAQHTELWAQQCV